MPDARIVAPMADAILFAVRWDHTSRAQVTEARLHLYSRDTWSWRPADHGLSIFAERSADAAQVGSIEDDPSRDGAARPLTSARAL